MTRRAPKQLPLLAPDAGDRYRFENEAREGGLRIVAGVDEAGRGPLAGPVAAAAVILPEGEPIAGLNDSKLLTEAVRERLFEEIHLRALVGVGWASPEEIDALNILQASLLAMRRAVGALPLAPLCLLIDGNQRIPGLRMVQRTIVKGDARSASIGAASIVAKVTRDQRMRELCAAHPGYGFSRHKGYPTPDHYEALRRLGPSPVHRRTFRGVLPAPE